MTQHEALLVLAMRSAGYDCVACDKPIPGFRLKARPIAGYTFSDPPFFFRTVQSAAEHLAPIVRYEPLTALISLA